MRKKTFVILFIAELMLPYCRAQISDTEIHLLKKLDSVQKSSSVSKYFSELYFKTTVKAANFFLNRNKKEKDFITRLEARFASFFFRSAEADRAGATISDEWEVYFNNKGLLPVQYKLLGINAHINGDIWQALTAEFSLDEIKKGRKSYFSFQKGLVKEYKDFYVESFRASEKVRLLHASTGGFDKFFGKWMLKRWRHRQMQLAILYYSNRERFQHKSAKLHQKMDHINQLILQNL